MRGNAAAVQRRCGGRVPLGGDGGVKRRREGEVSERLEGEAMKCGRRRGREKELPRRRHGSGSPTRGKVQLPVLGGDVGSRKHVKLTGQRRAGTRCPKARQAADEVAVKEE
eukprot:65127-Pleurochrysis_carterae.AAC.1